MLNKFFLVVLCVVLAGISPSFVTSSVAQTYDKEAAKERRSRRTPPLRERVYKYLGAAQKLADQGDYTGAADKLAPLAEMTLNSYEAAQFWNFSGYLFYAGENYPAALVAYEKVLEQINLPPRMEDQTLVTIAQLSFLTGDYQKSIDHAVRYSTFYEKIPGNILRLIGQAYVALEEFDKALPYMERAKNVYLAEKKNMTRPDYNQLLYLYYILDQKYNILLTQMEFMKVNPNREGWTALAKICTKLIQEHVETAPVSIPELEKIRDDALNEAATPTLHQRQAYTGMDKPVEYVSPRYPREALLASKEGEVKLQYDVSSSGNVINIRVLFSSDPIFEPAAQDALMAFKFNPEGMPVETGEGISLGNAEIAMPEDDKPESLLEPPLTLDQYNPEAASGRTDFEQRFTFTVKAWPTDDPVKAERSSVKGE